MSLRRQPEARHAVGVEPHRHAVVGRREQRDVADAGDALELVDDVDGRVVGEKELVVAAVRRRQRDDLQQRRRLLLDADALRLDLGGQLRLGEADAVLHLDGVEIGIGADREGDGERVAAVVAAGRLHVEHLVDADDLRLDRLRDRRLHHLGAGARRSWPFTSICGGTMSGNCAIGICVSATSAGERDDDRDDDRQPRPGDEDVGDHRLMPPAASFRSA